MAGRGKKENNNKNYQANKEWQERKRVGPSLLAILARFSGNRKQAWAYCMALALAYPNLTEEYSGYSKELL